LKISFEDDLINDDQELEKNQVLKEEKIWNIN
jgi:hypothetical protein